MMKKLIVSLLLLALCLSLTACFGGGATSKSAEEQLDALGFTEKVRNVLLPGGQGFVANDPEGKAGDVLLYSTASFEDVQKALYDACKMVSDDDIVRDYMTEEPMEFAFDKSAEIVWFGYKREGNFCSVAISEYYDKTIVATAGASTEASTEAPEASTEAAAEATEAATEAASEATEAPAGGSAEYTIYLLQWD